MGWSPVGLCDTKLFFQAHCECVFPLGLGAVFVGGRAPERTEFVELIEVVDLPSHAVHGENSRERFFIRQPSRRHGKARAMIVRSRARRWWKSF
jgi:hypothetical protein